jgi:hypothetical protein
MAAKTSSDSTLGVSAIIFSQIQNSFTTRGIAVTADAFEAVDWADGFLGEGPSRLFVTRSVTLVQNLSQELPAKMLMLLARSERFELPTLGFEVRC